MGKLRYAVLLGCELFFITVCDDDDDDDYDDDDNDDDGYAFMFCPKKYKYHKLPEVLPEKTTLTRDDAVKYYTEMQSIRRMEAEASKLYKERVVRGFCHLYTGQVLFHNVLICLIFYLPNWNNLFSTEFIFSC